MSSDLSFSRSHSRTSSNSVRIPIQFNSRKVHSTHDLEDYKDTRDSNWIHSVQRWLGGRVVRGGGVLARPWLRRWMVLIAVVGIVLLTLSKDKLTSFGSSWSSHGEAWDVNAVPKVDRAVLEKLRLLELHYGPDDEWEGGYRANSYSNEASGEDSPPLVANLPEIIKSDPLSPPIIRLPKTPSDILDAEICPERNGQPCSFLFVGFIGEQETKAQLHLHQLGLLAIALNRTLVLPNVAKSRMGSCYTNPFSFYYSPSSLSALGIPTISHENFLAWNDRRESSPSAQIVSIPGPSLAYPQGAVEIDSISDSMVVPKKPTRKLCLKAPKTALDFSQFSPLAIYAPDGYHKSESSRKFADSLVTTLKSENVGLQSQRMEGKKQYSRPDVLVFNWELRFAILTPSLVFPLNIFPNSTPAPLSFTHFPYAERWANISLQISNSLSPFISIHWRTETLPANNLVPCANSLVKKISDLHSQYPSITTVYLATDYPLQEIFPPPPSTDASDSTIVPMAHSGTFAKSITLQHHTAFKTFLVEFEKLSKSTRNTLRLTTFDLEIRKLDLEESLRKHLIPYKPSLVASISQDSAPTQTTAEPFDPTIELDSGLIGIVDKGVTMRSELFLTGLASGFNGATNTCGKVSSFTRKIVGIREERRKLEKEDDENELREIEDHAGEYDKLVGGSSGRKLGTLWNAVSYWSTDGKGEEVQNDIE